MMTVQGLLVLSLEVMTVWICFPSVVCTTLQNTSSAGFVVKALVDEADADRARGSAADAMVPWVEFDKADDVVGVADVGSGGWTDVCLATLPIQV